MQPGPFMQSQGRHMLGPISRDWSLSQAPFNGDLGEQPSLTVSNAGCQPGMSSRPANVSGLLATRWEQDGKRGGIQSEGIWRRVGRLDALPSHWICWCLLAARDETTSRPGGLLLWTGRLNGGRPQQFTRASRRRGRRETMQPPGCAGGDVCYAHLAPLGLADSPRRDGMPCFATLPFVDPEAALSRASVCWHSTRARRRTVAGWPDASACAGARALPTPFREMQTALWGAGAAPHPRTP